MARRGRELRAERSRPLALLLICLLILVLVPAACNQGTASGTAPTTGAATTVPEQGSESQGGGAAAEGLGSEEAAVLLANVHWLGHASFKLTGEKVIYIDPWQLEGGETADIVLITHEHYDHCSSADVARILGPQTAVVVAGNCTGQFGENVQRVKPGDRLTVQGIPIETVPAYNVGKDYHPRDAGGVGYIVTMNGLRIYHAGDTDHTPEMDEVKADIALLPAGGTYTMTASEAAAAANTIQPRVAVPMHWGSVVGGEPDAERFRDECIVPVAILTPESP